MIAITHVLFGLAIAYVLRLPVAWAMIGAVLPDIDILIDASFPFVHRGIVHTPVAAGTAALVLGLATGDRDPAAALGTGYLSHLFLDTFTYSGIMWLYPVATHLSLELVGYDDVAVNLGIMVLAAAVPVLDRYGAEVAAWLR